MKYKVRNMYSSNGNKVANQFVIYGNNEEIFQSYNTIIAIKNRKNGKTKNKF